MNSEKEIKIYAFHYRPDKIFLNEDIYIPVWAGKNGELEKVGFTGDDTGDNISEKNKYYSELTGIYWIWKNSKSDIVGSCHYRRYFTAYNEPFLYHIKRLIYYPAGLWKKRYGLIYTKNINLWKPKILNKSQINTLLNDYDIILPTRRILRQSIERHYNKYHNPNDLILIKNILSEQFPEYLPTFESMIKNNQLFANNMFVTRWETFEKLAKWLFSILFTFEKRSNLNQYKGYQERIFGFLSERLITLWVQHNKLNYKELQLIYFKKLKKKTNA